jgi:predicted DNA-binding transcriptional regulator AlpA
MPKLLTPSDLAALLGISIHTVYHRKAQGLDLPPAIKVGRLLRFPDDGVRHWLVSLRSEQASVRTSAIHK